MLTVKFESNFDSDPSFDFLQGEVHEFTGKVQNCLRGGVHLPPLPPPQKKQNLAMSTSYNVTAHSTVL